MTRRHFLKQSIGAGALLSLATPAVGQTTKTLRLATTDTATAQTLATYVSTVTNGALTLEVDAIATADAPNLLGDVANGSTDMCLTGLDHFLEENLAFGLFATMPFGMCTGELEGWLHVSDGAEMLAMLAAPYGVSMQFAGDQGVNPIWSKQPLPTMADMQGLAVGSSGLGIRNLQQAGVANVTDLASADLASLDIIDGMSIADMAAANLTVAFPYITTNNPNRPSAVMSLITNNGVMDSLSEGEKSVIATACSATLNEARARNLHTSLTALDRESLSVRAIPDDVWQALSTSAQTLLETIFNQGNTEATVVDSYVYFLTDVAGWSEIGEAAFYKGRQRSLAL